MGYRLGVDLGTTFTAAAVDDGTGPTMLGLGNRALTVPSVVFLSPEGTFLFGEAADRRAVGDPSRSAREFKRRIGDTVPILLAGQPFSPQALSAKLLAWTISVATERQGAAPDQVVVTYPANWGGYKRDLLQQVITLADAPTALTCTEPEAAATQYASRARLSAGEKVAVYDLGGGTFDVCVLEKHEDGFAILGSPDGVEHLGGIDFDEAVFQHVLGMLGDQVAGLDPSDPQVTDGLARLRRECVEAKEALSNDVETTVSVLLPGLTTSVRLTRAELDGLITSPLRDTLDAMQRALRSAHLAAADLATIVLVGGSSRIPLVSHLLQSEFGVHTALDTHPKHDIALGAVQYHPTEASVPAPAAAPSVIRWPTRGRKQTSQTPPVAPRPVEPTPDEPATQPLPVAREEPKAEPRSGPPAWTPPTDPDTSPTGWHRPLVIVLAAAAAVAVLAGATFVLSRGAKPEDPVAERVRSSAPEPGSTPTHTKTAAVTCWDGREVADPSHCSTPTGRLGFASVFPSFDAQCHPAVLGDAPGKKEVFVCYYDDHRYLIRYSRWTPGADRLAYYREANAGAHEEAWDIAGRHAGRQWTSFEVGDEQPYQWSAAYDDEPFSVSVEATSAALRAEGIKRVVARSSTQAGLR
jgi:actin-like ATPase involved in cell morphogenesis